MSLIQLNETQQEIQAMARAYAQRELVPLAGERDQESRFDRVMVTQMAELGFFGMLTPERFDGLDLDAQSYLLALEEIAVGDASAAVLLSVHNSLPTQMILDFGTEAQQQRFLPPMARGEWLGAFALSEPEAGSDAAALRCQAVRDGDDWLLSGTKAWVSHGNEAGVILCMARTDSPDDRQGSKGISTFILTPDLPGFHLAKKENKMGLRASPTLQINLDNCRVPGDRLLGEAGQGFVYAMGSLDHGRLGIEQHADLLVVLDGHVGQGQGEGGGAAHHLAGGVVLGAVAGAHEFVGTAVPGHHTAQVGADGVDAVAADGIAALDEQVGGIALETLHQTAVALLVGAQPASGRDAVAELVLGRGAAAAASGLGGDEIAGHGIEGTQGDPGDRSKGQQVHELPTTHSGHITS